VKLTAWEEERLLIFTAAELARRHQGRGLLLNGPEATAIICDAMLDAARAGASYEEVETAGRAALTRDDVLPGVPALVQQVIVEVLMDDGTRLIALHEPLGPAGDAAPGAIRQAARRDPSGERDRIELEVTNTSRRVIRVSSHYPFDLVNARLRFDRTQAIGRRLDLDAGSTERWAPGETRTVVLVKVG